MTSHPDIVTDIMSRLPPGNRIPLIEVCVALDKHRDVIEGWIESGEVEAIDLGGRSAHYWEISRSSLETHLRRRCEGIRPRRSDPRQLHLFNPKSETQNPK